MASNAAPEFTDRDIKLITASLPDRVERRRLELLPQILREWSRTDLQEHLSPEPRAVTRERYKRLETVANRAAKLSQALDALDDTAQFGIAVEMAREEGQPSYSVSPAKIAALKERLGEERDFLIELAAAAPRAFPKPGRGQPRNIAGYLVMQDIAAIFEWLTKTRAGRGVDRTSGAETGPFWQFAAAVWPVVFGNGDHGLAASMKTWAHARTKYRERSPLIANINFRYPTWGVFDH